MIPTSKISCIAAAAALLLATAPAHAVLERMGPVDKALGGYPAWFQDRTGIAMEFCDLQSQAELDSGWCALVPPTAVFPESFPNAFATEHFYYRADNALADAAQAFKAQLTIALGAGFENRAVVEGRQETFGRMRVFIPNLPLAGDYRVVTPYTDVTYLDQKAGDNIIETTEVGLACVNTFECTLDAALGPFLLPAASAGGAELPPMPALAAGPRGSDPFYDALVAAGTATADPGTGKAYLADPKRVGAVTGSLLPAFVDSTGASRSHNTFRIEVRAPAPAHDGPVIFAIDGETNFSVNGRLMTGAVPSKVGTLRATYKADAQGNVTDLDVFAQAGAALQARRPGQPLVPPAALALSFHDQACAGALGVDPVTGATIVNLPPYSAPAGVAHALAETDKDFWGQSQPGGLPPQYVCVVDASARDAAGLVVPAYYLQRVTDEVTIASAAYNGPDSGTLTVTATSSDPTAVLTLAGYGSGQGTASGRGAGTGVELAASTATVTNLLAPPSTVHVISNRGGEKLLDTVTARGGATVIGTPVATGETATMFEDCSPTAATSCAPGQSLVVDLLANDTVDLNGTVTDLRSVVANNLAAVTVSTTAPTLGVASVSPDGQLTYTPNANATGVETINYTVTVAGKVSNQAVVVINITPVNDAPVAGNATIGTVVGGSGLINLIGAATDPDGKADVKDAVILSWPPELGARPVPVNGVVPFTASTFGNFAVTYQVKDAAGLLSANTGTATVTVIGNETLLYTKSNFKAGNGGGGGTTRWTVSGLSTIRAGQTMTIAYQDGTLRTGGTCNGTATIPACVVGTAVVDATSTWTYDQVGTAGGPTDPTDLATWLVPPRALRTFSSSPVLGGSATAAIVLR